MPSVISKPFFQNPAVARIAPFAAFMLFIAFDEGLAFLHQHAVITFNATARLWLYLPKVALTTLLLWVYRRHYLEVDLRELQKFRPLLLSIGTGAIIYALWINMDWALSSQAAPPGFDPGRLAEPWSRWLLIAIRCFGAVIIVPIMEELFWRSFLLRFLIDNNFMAVAIGRWSWFAVIASSILFGLEHHYVFAGMMAGLLFCLVYAYTKSIAHCILSHAIANLCLAIHVLITRQWHFW